MANLTLKINEQAQTLWPLQVYRALQEIGFPKLPCANIQFNDRTFRIHSETEKFAAGMRELQQQDCRKYGYIWLNCTGCVYSMNFANTISVIDCGKNGIYFVM